MHLTFLSFPTRFFPSLVFIHVHIVDTFSSPHSSLKSLFTGYIVSSHVTMLDSECARAREKTIGNQGIFTWNSFYSY